jgi:ABC-type glycerol-3-phosphate transport system permease component
VRFRAWRPADAAARVLLAGFCLAAIVPFLYVVSTSLKRSRSLYSFPPDWIPDHPTLRNYELLLVDHPFGRWALNTLLVAGTITAIKVVIDSMAAYAFAKLPFAGRRALFGAMLATIMIPPALLLIPLFFLVRDLGLLDTYWALILPPLANPVGVFILRGYIQALPPELEQAARLDDCNPWQIYRYLIVPLVKPGLVVIATYTFLTQYIEFVWPLVAVESDDKLLLTTGLSTLRTQIQTIDWGLLSAASVLAMVPITLVFLLFQRRFVAASLTGGLKD